MHVHIFMNDAMHACSYICMCTRICGSAMVFLEYMIQDRFIVTMSSSETEKTAHVPYNRYTQYPTLFTSTHTHTHAHAHAHAHTHTHTHTHTHMHTHTHTHIYTRM